jgi:hypothetical protein
MQTLDRLLKRLLHVCCCEEHVLLVHFCCCSLLLLLSGKRPPIAAAAAAEGCFELVSRSFARYLRRIVCEGPAARCCCRAANAGRARASLHRAASSTVRVSEVQTRLKP